MLTRALIAAFLLAVSGCVTPHQWIEQRAQNHSVLVEFIGGGHCTGTKIARHVLLIVKHCVDDYPGFVVVDGLPANVIRTHMDGGDQARIEVDLTFGSYAKVGKPPKVGDAIFIIGNPGPLRHVLRRGYVAGEHVTAEGPMLIADINFWFGDSGAAVFNDRGEVVGTTYGGYADRIFKIGLIQPILPGEA